MPDAALSGWPTRATDDFAVVAPDGIVVHPIPLPGLLGLTLAEGRLPPGDFAVHAYRSLEQLTYVLARRLLATMGDPASGEMVELDCGPGVARVLYICAPPYPADDVDTATVDRHRALTAPELDAALARVRAVRAATDAHFAALADRITDLRAAR